MRIDEARSRGQALVLTIAIVLLTACGSAGPTTSAPSSSAAPTTTPTAVATSEPSAAASGTATRTRGTATVSRAADASATVVATPSSGTATLSPTTVGAATAGQATPTAKTTSSLTPAPTTADQGQPQGGGGGKNEVRAINRTDGRLQIKGNVQLNHIPGPNVEPVNLAYAYSSCTDCQTFAVALQIDLIGRDAQRIAPQNAAVALNERCLRCFTAARALQYVYQVDDPTQTPDNVAGLIREMDRTLHDISTDHGITLQEAQSRINAVIAQFSDLAQHLNDRQDTDDRGDSPGTPTVTASPATSPTGTPAPTPGATTTPTVLPTATTRSTSTMSPTATVSTTATPTGAPTPSATP